MDPRPVLYLDLDDTLISWRGGEPRAAPGAGDFLSWALPLFEVRWLTTWCPSGEMEDGLLSDLCSMLVLPEALLQEIRGFAWAGTDTKLNGISWLEHFVLQRPFIWLEDEFGVGERERAFLARWGLQHNYRHCNVTADPYALRRVHAGLRLWLTELGEEAA